MPFLVQTATWISLGPPHAPRHAHARRARQDTRRIVGAARRGARRAEPEPTAPEPPRHRGRPMSSPAVDALRHDAPAAYLVLDDEDRITHVSARLHDDFGRWISHVLWDHLPGARDVYGPTFDEARSSGCPVESVVFYSGRVKRLDGDPRPGRPRGPRRAARPAGRHKSRDVDSEPGSDRGRASWSSVRATRFTSSRVSASSSLRAASSTACAVAASGHARGR